MPSTTEADLKTVLDDLAIDTEQKAEKARNCPFYGRHQVMLGQYPAFVLVSSGGNQCSLIHTSFSPCQMEIKQQPVDWKQCRVAQSILITIPPQLGMFTLPGEDDE